MIIDHETVQYWRDKYDKVIVNYRRQGNELSRIRRNERRLLQLLDILERELDSLRARMRNLRRFYHHSLRSRGNTTIGEKENCHGKEKI